MQFSLLPAFLASKKQILVLFFNGPGVILHVQYGLLFVLQNMGKSKKPAGKFGYLPAKRSAKSQSSLWKMLMNWHK